jgi:hypothetical protein
MTTHSDFWRYCDRLTKIVDELLKTNNIDRTPFELDGALDEMLHPPSGIEGIEALWAELRALRQTAIDFQHGHANRQDLQTQLNRLRLLLVERDISDLQRFIDEHDST